MLNDDLRKLVLAGIGAASVSAEKAAAAVEELSKRGEETVHQGKIVNEQLKHDLKQAVKENVAELEQQTKDAVDTLRAVAAESFKSALASLSPEELEHLKSKLGSFTDVVDEQLKHSTAAPEAAPAEQPDEPAADEPEKPAEDSTDAK